MNNTMKQGLAVCAAAGLAVGALGVTRAGAMGDMRPMPKMPMVMTEPPMTIKAKMDSNLDMLFMMHAAGGNAFEVASGKLALQKSRNAGVRLVAKTIIMGHGMAQQDLAKHFRAMGMMIPNKPGPGGMAALAMLRRTPSGAAFDKAFMACQTEAHEGNVVLFEHEIDSGRNGTVKAFATNKLPGILEHTALIYNVAANVNAPIIKMRPKGLTMMGMPAMKMKM